ncbi:hypothetical protein SAMN06295905_1159 [Devosia lucknowensis]|uniref:Membrane-anchored ribosome-binding protein, inhibits growth in stationary phase, ElaB/YqjD/DUF883 family n=1 Tax=Devosia lucknowensis TaxID=1096929 RepID=A0A1Y6ERJ5_9HYPH|nr:hypothetical protein [Devosia lucknowensis]SMQ65177.1 hypothetical protein SAMN06295905_1159 [Devosia lucknowensis]
MSLDSLLTQLGLQRHDPHSLEAQLHAMRREVRRIGKTLSHHASHRADDWADQFSDFGRDAARQTSHFAHLASEQALRGADTIRRDPLPLIAVIGTGLLLARLLKRQ